MKHTLSVLVENHPGVLSRVAGLFARRGFNIESLAVGTTTDPGVSCITIVADDRENVMEQLEKQLKEYLGTENLVLFVNGHMALEMVIQALELKGEVITTPFTFASTTHAIVRNGLTPVFCDIEPDHYTMDPDRIEALITEKTSAILPVHVYGNFCDVDRIQKIADRHGLKVIYDAAHTFGARYRGKSAAAYGDAYQSYRRRVRRYF